MPLIFAPCGATRRSLVFEHAYYGPILVANMLDLDDEPTDDLELACRLVCALPNGDWLATCACPNCGRLREIPSGVH